MYGRLIVALITLGTFTTSLYARAAEPVSVRVVIPSPRSLDPVAVPRADLSTRSLVENLFVGLTRFDPSTKSVQPALAKGWQISADQLTYTFTLRPDIQWVTYNSLTQKIEAVRPVVAGDFFYALRRACDPTPPNPVTHTVYIVKGCRTIATANPAFVDDIFIARELGAQALSDQTLEIKLAFAAPYFPTLLTLPEFRPVAREMKSDTPLTNGLYTVTKISNEEMTLVRNPFWSEPSSGSVERVNIAFAETSERYLQEMSSGADFALLDPGTAIRLRQAKPDLIKAVPSQAVTVLGFSAERSIAQKDAFRRAFSQAINRSALVNLVLSDLALPASHFTPPGILAGSANIALPDNSGYVPDAAKTTFEQAGFAGCKLSEKVDFTVDDQPLSSAIAQVLVGQWKDVLGCSNVFNLTAVKPEMAQAIAHFTVDVSDKDAPPRPHLWLYTWTPDYPDANAWTGDALHCEYGFLRTYTPCSDAEAQIDKAFLETDPAVRAAEYAQAEDDWFGAGGLFPVTPLYVPLEFAAQQPWLSGVVVGAPIRFDQWKVAPHS